MIRKARSVLYVLQTLTFYLCPTPTRSRIQGAKVVGTGDDLNPFAAQTIAKSPADAWKKTVERREDRVPKSERKYGDKCKSLDSCGFYSAGLTPDAGTLALRLPKVCTSERALC
jgi:hypothetical protein